MISISNSNNSLQCASSQSSLSEKINVKTEDASQSESRPEVVSKLTRKQTVRKFFRSASGRKVYICYLDSCSRHFNHLSSLIKHERIHRNERPYVCGICGQSFVQSSNLKRHEKAHTGEKPYKCELCPKQFSTACNLRQHSQIHENCSGELKYSCSKCGKAYIYTSSLIKHQKKCTPTETQSDDTPRDLETEVVADSIRKLVKTEEKSNDHKIPTIVHSSDECTKPLCINSFESALSLKNKILSDLSNAVRTKHSPLGDQSVSTSFFPQLSTPHTPSLSLLSQTFHGVGSTASRIGFGFSNPSSLYPLQNRSPLPFFNLEMPSDPMVQAAMEQRLVQQNMELRYSIQSRLLRNGRF